MTDRPADGLDPDERAELQRLRAEVADLRQRPPGRPSTDRAGPRWRSILSVVLIAFGSVLLLPATVALWLDSVVTDTDRYVDTVAPLAEDEAIQDAVARRVTTEVVDAIDVEGLVDDIAGALGDQGVGPRATLALEGLAGPLADGVEGWIGDHVQTIVRSDQFADIWREANRRAHDQIVRVLTEGESDGAIVVDGNVISLDVGPVVDAVKKRLVDAGVGLADRIPAIETEIRLVETEHLDTARTGFALVNGLGVVLPVLALVLIGAGILIANDRRRALIQAGLGAAIAMLALGAVLTIARPIYTNAIPENVDTAASIALFEQVIGYLRITLRSVFAVGVVVAAVAFLTGPSRSAVAARGSLRTVGTSMDRRGWRDNPVATWLGMNKRAVQIGILVLAVLVFLFWDYPSGGVVLGIALVAAALAIIVEILAVPEEAHVR